MARAALVAAAALLLAGCGGGSGEWRLPNHDTSSTRATKAGVDARALQIAWRFRIPSRATDAGAMTATPVVASGVVYAQDMRSNVYALDLKSGAVRWTRRLDAPSPGPNGVAVDGGRVYGATDQDAFALSTRTGRVLWRRLLTAPRELFVDVAPQVADGVVYLATVGMGENGAGALYALDGRTGRLLWRRATVAHAWAVPSEAGGGGAWYPPSVADGTVYWGTANPTPFGGTVKHPNGGAFAGPALYTDSLLALDVRSGGIRWHDQVTPHDVRDHDFQLPPILTGAKVIGGGKAGLVIAWDTKRRTRGWVARVGVHRNDTGPLPSHRVEVCPGLFGGVETPMAYADGRVFVPVVDLCSQGSATGYQPVGSVDPSAGTGEMVALDAATGRRLWTRRLPQPDFGCATVAGGELFTSTVDGTFYVLDARTGAIRRRLELSAGINGCPSVAGKTLLVPAGISGAGPPVLVALRAP